jgi:hypothetical protein
MEKHEHQHVLCRHFGNLLHAGWFVVESGEEQKPEWFKDEASKRLTGGVYASFLIPKP